MSPAVVYCWDGIHKTAHSVYCLQYHVVWVCKYRRRILNPGVCSEYSKNHAQAVTKYARRKHGDDWL